MVAPPTPHGSTFLGVYPRLLNHFRCMHVCACIYPSVFHVSRFLHSEQKGTPWLMSLDFFIKSLRKSQRKMLLDLLGQILPSFLIRYRSKTLLELLGPVPLHFFNKSSPNFMGNAPGASWANSSLFLLDPFQILLETIHKAPWANSFAFLH